MKFSYNWLQSFFQEKLPEPKKLAESLTLFLFEVDELEKRKDDWMINIDVLPNRASDCFSHQGIAREISCFFNFKLKKNSLLKLKPGDSFRIEVKDKKKCPRYSALLIENIKVQDSPSWLKDKLEICGLQSINNVVDVINYAMLESGQPMHAFDFDKISEKRIIVRQAKEKEKMIGLDNKEYSLNPETLVIADPEKILGIAGIKGGKNAEITKKTTTILLESANFDRRIIRKASRDLNLRTDASLRFEHGLSSELTKEGLATALSLLTQLINAQAKELNDFYPVKEKNKKVKLSLVKLSSLLGKEIKKQEAKKTLEKLNFKIVSENKNYLLVRVPSTRLDVEIQEDLIEEVGRIHGYQNIKPQMPETVISLPIKNKNLFWQNQAKNVFQKMGFIEAYNYSFISQEQAETFELKNLYEIEKPISLEQKYLRPSLIPNLFKNVFTNQEFFKEIKIFELGHVFTEKGEKQELSGVANSFLELKGSLELFFQEMNIDVKFIQGESSCFFNENSSADIYSGKTLLGKIGVASSRIRGEMKIKKEFSAFLISFNEVEKLSLKNKEYQKIAKFPETVRDLSVLVPRKVSFQEMLDAIEIKNPLIEKIELFDIYQGKEIPLDKKSFNLRFVYRDSRKTLSASEVNLSHEKIIRKIENNKNWKIRK
jgi:phenylalanyl-tRNA synthetase beta chain